MSDAPRYPEAVSGRMIIERILFRVTAAGEKGVEVCLPDCGPRLERRTA